MSKKHKKKKEEKKETKTSVTKKKMDQWQKYFFGSVFVIIVLFILMLSGLGCSGTTGSITSDQASQKLSKFIVDAGMVPEGTQVAVDGISENSGLYEVNISLNIQGQTQKVTSYMSKNGEYFFPQGMNIDDITTQLEGQQQTQEQTQEVPKSETPTVNAFIMSHCPYGLQFLKAYTPVIELLGDKANLNVNFVDYLMHGEKELNDNNRLYCIQKEAAAKFADYVRCFVEDKGYETCLQNAGIDRSTIDTCIQNLDEEYNLTEIFQTSESQFPAYPVETTLNDQYGIGGSPTFVINGKTVSVSRSANAIKEAICSAFENPPSECDTQLSTTSEQAGMGAIGSGSGSDTGAQC